LINNNINYKEFLFNDIFKIERGHYNKRPENEGVFKFVSASRENNGVTDYIDKSVVSKIYNGNCITVVNNGESTGRAFYQPTSFTCSHDVNILRLKKYELNSDLAFFLIPIIEKQKFKYNYGRKWRVKRMEKTKISLPVDDNEKPNWDYMTKYVQNIKHNLKLLRLIKDLEEFITKKRETLKSTNWKYFLYSDIFDVCKGKRLVISNLDKGDTNFVSSTEYNNGISNKVDVKPNNIGNVITVNYDGSVGEAFYQPKPFWALDSVNVLYPKFQLNQHIAMFLIPLIKKEKFRFSYGRKWHQERMKQSKIKLPVDSNNNPDWEFMEKYIKSLPYSKKLM